MNEEKDIQLTPEELEEAIADFKAKKANTSAADCENTDEDENIEESEDTTKEDGDCETTENEDDDIIDKIIEFLGTLKAGKKPADNEDSEDDESEDDEEKSDSEDDEENKSINADSADELFRQRLSICRTGDKLHMDGLENKSIIDGKKAIIKKVLPNIRLDGKSKAYIDAAYDLAVSEASKRKDVSYQRNQMRAGTIRKDSSDGKSMAEQAREKMIKRNGGNE